MRGSEKLEIAAVEGRRCAAVQALDMAALDGLFADDLIHIHSNGMVHDKDTLLRHVQAKGVGVRVERGKLHIRVVGNAAVVVGSIANHTPQSDGSTSVLTGMVTQVLRKDPSGWRFINFHFTQTPS